MHHYRHHIGDFLAATDHLSNEEAHVYLRLLWTYYDTEEPLPDNKKWLAKKARTTVETVKEILDEFFTLDDDCWTHSRCHDLIVEYQRKVLQTSEAGRRGAKAKAKAAANAKRTSSERSTNAQRTSNHKPVTSNQGKKKSNTKPEKVSAASRARPRDLDVVIQYWEEANLSGDPNAFFDHFESNGWKVSGKAPMKDWKASARNWSRREIERNEKSKRTGGSGKSHHAQVVERIQRQLTDL